MKSIKSYLYFFISVILLFVFTTGCNFYHKDKDNTVTIDKKQKINELLKNSKFLYLDEKNEVEKYYKIAESRKSEILNSKTKIVKAKDFIAGETYTGTAYYISEKGADYNNGLTPNNPIKTIKQLNRINLKKGDAVFFERGYIYRTPQEAIIVKPYVTYSAYGEGEKPILTRVAENSAKKEYWDLYYKDKNGKKIWKYNKEIGDVAGIVFDDKTYANRVIEWPTSKGWLALKKVEKEPHKGNRAKNDASTNIEVKSASEYKTVEASLKENLSYISRINIENIKYPFDILQHCKNGELYLRFDKGNPADFFYDIEIISFQTNDKFDIGGRIFDSNVASNYVIDNIALKYYTITAISGNPKKSKNAIIQNSSLEWGGASIYKIKSEIPENDYMFIGDGLYLFGNNSIFRNNYVTQNGNALVFEDFKEGKTKLGTFIIENNIIENCTQGIRLGMKLKNRKKSFDNIIIKNNIILNSGNSMNNACFEEPVAIDMGSGSLQYSKHFDVSNNIMIGSKMALMRIPSSKQVKINIENNIFAQERNGILLNECEWDSNGNIKWYLMKDLEN